MPPSEDFLPAWLTASHHHLVVVAFFTEWAGSVSILRTFMSQIEKDFPRIEIVWVNVEEHPELSADLGVHQVPTVVMFRNRKMVDHISGLVSRKLIAQRIEAVL